MARVPSRLGSISAMSGSVARGILQAHLVEGVLRPGEEIAIRVDQTLTQDATGTLAWLEFEALGVPRVRTELAVSYVDHNMLQTGFENADDHRFLRSMAARYGAWFSGPGNGICHQVHLERFAVPGKTLLGSDSHTPMAGAVGMLAIGAGGLDVAVAMAGHPYRLACPEIVGVRLVGALPPWVSGKDIILELLRRLGVSGGRGKIFEFFGPGVATLAVWDRNPITNMGAELGATSTIFPADERTREYLAWQGCEQDYTRLGPADAADFETVIDVDLSRLGPMVAAPSSPGNVVPVEQVAGTPLAQVCVGSCNNSSDRDLTVVASVLRGRRAAAGVDLSITPGSRQVLERIAADGTLVTLAAAGARILEAACGPCIGMGQAPPTGKASLRTMNRNFPGRSGTPDDQVFLASPEVAAASALAGAIADPRELGRPPEVRVSAVGRSTSVLVPPMPEDAASRVEIERGPNIKELPQFEHLADDLVGPVLITVGDDVTTDHILPAGAEVLPLRSNIPAISRYVMARLDPTFSARASKAGAGFVVAGKNYGQGSSREHAAIAPRYLGVRAVIARSFARIHRTNLINFGIVPLIFDDEEEKAGPHIAQGDSLAIPGIRRALENGSQRVEILDRTNETTVSARLDVNEREANTLLAGGLLNYLSATTD
jgi:aconitate hydratase